MERYKRRGEKRREEKKEEEEGEEGQLAEKRKRSTTLNSGSHFKRFVDQPLKPRVPHQV